MTETVWERRLTLLTKLSRLTQCHTIIQIILSQLVLAVADLLCNYYLMSCPLCSYEDPIALKCYDFIHYDLVPWRKHDLSAWRTRFESLLPSLISRSTFWKEVKVILPLLT